MRIATLIVLILSVTFAGCGSEESESVSSEEAAKQNDMPFVKAFADDNKSAVLMMPSVTRASLNGDPESARAQLEEAVALWNQSKGRIEAIENPRLKAWLTKIVDVRLEEGDLIGDLIDARERGDNEALVAIGAKGRALQSRSLEIASNVDLEYFGIDEAQREAFIEATGAKPKPAKAAAASESSAQDPAEMSPEEQLESMWKAKAQIRRTQKILKGLKGIPLTPQP